MILEPQFEITSPPKVFVNENSIIVKKQSTNSKYLERQAQKQRITVAIPTPPSHSKFLPEILKYKQGVK